LASNEVGREDQLTERLERFRNGGRVYADNPEGYRAQLMARSAAARLAADVRRGAGQRRLYS
jgi:hypothetical protein